MVPPPCFPTPPNQCSVAEMKICIFLVLLFYEFVSVSSYVFFMLFEFCWELTGIYEKSAFSTNLPCYQTLVYFSHAFVFDFKHFFLFYMDHPKKHHEVQAILLDLLRFFFLHFCRGIFFCVYPSVQFVTPYNMIGKIHNSKNSVFLSVCGAFELVLPMRACLPIFFFCLLCVHRGKIIFGVLSKLVGGNHQRWTQKQ